MTRLQGNRLLRVYALRHPLLGFWGNHSIVGRNLIPTGLRFPRRCSRLILEATPRDGFLCERHHQRLGLVEILAEAFAKLVRGNPKKSVLVGTDIRCARGWFPPCENAAEAVPLVRRKRGHVNESNNIWRVTRPSDDRAAIGMANQQRRTILRGSQLACSVDIVGQ